MNNNGKAGIAAAFTAMGIAGLAILNLAFSPGYIWFYYAAFAALWWPLAAFFLPRRNHVGFALAGSAMTVIFLAIVNLQNSPSTPWFLNVLFPLAWWPLSIFFARKRHFKGFAIAGSALMVVYLVVTNFIYSPGCPWFLYACYPFIWWPIVMYLGRKAGTFGFSLLCSAVTIAYYAALNVLLSPGYAWAIYPAFAILWWPLTLFFARRKSWSGYSVAATVFSAVFFITVNVISSPSAIWAFYPIFALLWWPVTMFFARRKNWLGYSAICTLLASAFFIAVNLITSPGALWAIYPIFALLWWPVTMFFAKRKNWFGYSIICALLVSVFLAAVNLITSPAAIWAVYPVFAIWWWPLSVYFFRYRKMKMVQ